MKRPLNFIVCVILFALTSPCFATDASKPNIIFIVADDLGIPNVGCYGGAFKTPNLDALAAGGTRFEYCFAAIVCAPSRAMLMTGRYAFRTGVTDNHVGELLTPQKDGCVAQLMKQAGYATAVAGKWRQLSYFTTKEDGAKWGFDEFLIWGDGTPEEGEEDGGKKKTDAEGKKSKAGRYEASDYNLNGKPLPGSKDKYGPDVLQEFVLDFVRRHKDEPFFVYYPTPLIHSPIGRTPDSGSVSRDEAYSKRKGLYADNIAYIDKQVGQLAAELDKLHLREKTLIVFTGDNGGTARGTVNGRPIDGRKRELNEGGSRVPLIASWPGTTPTGAVRKDLTDFTDLLPTFAALAGVALPTERTIDGHSLAPQLRGEVGQPREWAYVQFNKSRYVRSERWKLTGDGQFFDMKDAPWKQIPVPADTSDAEAKAARVKLQAALAGLHNDSSSANPLSKRARKKAAK
jgi:arylsulfatase A